MRALALHGGAGTLSGRLALHGRQRYEASLGEILDLGLRVLADGGSSLDAVTLVVRSLEDDPLFNAGRGAGLTREGTVELDAAIMDGATQKAGAVAAVSHVKNPVDLARRVMERSRHVLLVGAGAEEFALEEALTLVPNGYFRTDERLQELESQQQGERNGQLIPGSQGTVGAVALDEAGNVAAATSTGGMTGKLPGRVSDSALIGAGTYAKNRVCAVSGTGHGEYFIRLVLAHHIATAVEYRHMPLTEAVREMVHVMLPGLGGFGGVIAVDGEGGVVMDFNTEGMFRASQDAAGRRVVAIGLS